MTVVFRKNIIHIKELESTNIYAMNLIKNTKFICPCVIVTDFQTNGKGQRRNNWDSEPEKNLLFSIAVNYKMEISNQFDLSVITSLSIIDFLNELKVPNISIKWPNDILVGSEKIAGILIQNITRSNMVTHSVIGIGLNVNQEQFTSFPRKAISIKNIISASLELNRALDRLLYFIEKRYSQYYKYNNININQYFHYLYLKDKISNFEINGKKMIGIIQSVSKEGKLIIKIKDSIKEFQTNEIRFLS